MPNTFPTAKEARAGSRNNLAIHAEIRAIEAAIYGAIDEGKLTVEVKDSPFTNETAINYNDPLTIDPTDYHGALFGDASSRFLKEEIYRSLKEQIDFVQKNFVDLGYQCQPLKNTSTGNTFLWKVLW